MKKSIHLYIRKIFTLIFFIFTFTLNVFSTNDSECYAKKIQQMRPIYPSGIGSIEGYSIVSYDIKRNGLVENIKVLDSQCVQYDSDEKSYFKKCPFFISVSKGAALYFEYKPPLKKSGESCKIENKFHRYNFIRGQTTHQEIDEYNGPDPKELIKK